jgi:hypothetical protein
VNGGGEERDERQTRAQDPEPDAKRAERAKRRIVFDDPLSGRSRDDTDTGWGGERGEGSRDRDWYLRETPPHHGEK